MNTLDPVNRSLSLPGGPAGPQSAAPGRAQVEALAQEFESMLILQVMRQVRQTMTSWGDAPGDADGGGVLGGNLDALTDTIDGELARYFTKAGGFGLSSYLAKSLTNAPARAAVPSQGVSQAAPQAAAAPAVTPAVVPAAAPAAQPGEPAASEADESETAVTETTTATPAVTTAAAASGEGGIPVVPPGAVTSPFGWRVDPLQHTTRFHGGIDIRAAYGQQVPAAADGRVLIAREQGGYGLTVVVEHADGFQTRYAHLSALSVSEGETVAEQQTVGLAGRTGRATGTHVHFELTRDGRRLDPTAAVQSRAFKKTVARADFRDGGWSSLSTASAE
jgi:murein DD-endopeptidase MepM/ murein hydrolase activator NlpD